MKRWAIVILAVMFALLFFMRSQAQDIASTPTPSSDSGMAGMGGMDMGATSIPDAGSMSGMHMGGSSDAVLPDNHMMEAITNDGVAEATEAIGGQPLNYRMEDGVKVFELTARPVLWNILDNIQVTAWTYNGTVPGSMIRVTEGDKVRIILKNELPEATTIHWHGIEVPNAMDGVAGITQNPILPGQSFTYEFAARPAGTFMYHSHFDSDVQVGIGMYAPFIIEPVQPENPKPDVDVTLMLSE